MKNILITGASRGIGLELTRQYAEQGAKVFATCRTPVNASSLLDLAGQFPNISIHRLNVTDKEQAFSLARELKNEHIDVLINNAAITGKNSGDSFCDLEGSDLMNVFESNVIGPLLVTQAFYSHLLKSKKKTLVSCSSMVGSIGDNTSGKSTSYRVSKTALNMLMKNISIEVFPDGIKTLLLSPGWVRTDMGGSNARLSVQESVFKLINIIDDENNNEPIKYVHLDGSIVPW